MRCRKCPVRMSKLACLYSMYDARERREADKALYEFIWRPRSRFAERFDFAVIADISVFAYLLAVSSFSNVGPHVVPPTLRRKANVFTAAINQYALRVPSRDLFRRYRRCVTSQLEF